jgi:hypothetical protein
MDEQMNTQLDRSQWLKLGAATAVLSVIAVLIVQIAAMAIWPEIALFKPLDSLARTAVFTAMPAAVATALFAWLARRKADPVPTFLKISAVVLVLSIIPDYLLPVEYKTFLASSCYRLYACGSRGRYRLCPGHWLPAAGRRLNEM